jgi:calcineurin-like phosphoesterase family protein
MAPEPLKTKWQDRDIWFTAGHRLGGPGYVEDIAGPHNERVEPEDLVWHLGSLTASGRLNLASNLAGRITLISALDDDTFVDAKGLQADGAVERLKKLAPNVRHVVTGRGFRRHRMAIQIPLGFGFAPVLLWSLPYTGAVDTAQWRPPIPSKSERLWLLHGQPSPVGEAVDVRNRQISVHRGCWDGRPVGIDDIRETIRNAS